MSTFFEYEFTLPDGTLAHEMVDDEHESLSVDEQLDIFTDEHKATKVRWISECND